MTWQHTLLIAWCTVSAVLAAGCGGVECGPGAVERDGVCAAADTFMTCGAGFRANGNLCEPIPEWVKQYCGPNTIYDARQNRCIGTGGSTTSCAKQCPAPSGSRICIQGQAYEGMSLMTGGADKSEKIKKSDGAVIKVYDPFDFLTNPSPVALGTAPIDDENGCFMVENVQVPFSGTVGIAVEDSVAGQAKFARFVYGANVAAGQNRTSMEIPGLMGPTPLAWGNDIVQQGSMLMWFRNKGTRKSIEGIKPLQDGLPPPWAGTDLFFFGRDATTSPYFETGATGTSVSGMVVVRKAPVKSYSGAKQGCTMSTSTGGSVPGVVFAITFESPEC